jgi:hypothetical protein
MGSGAIFPAAGLSLIFFWLCHSIMKNRAAPRRNAAERFAEAFTDEIQDLSQGSGDAFELLRVGLLKHERTYLYYRTYLQGENLRQFDEAWEAYFGHGQGDPQYSREQYSAAGNISLAQQKRSLALKRIRRLLSFAEKV